MGVDQCGYELTGASPETVDRYDHAVRSLLLFAEDVGEAWDATVADEPGFALGQIGRAYLRCLSSEQPDAAEAGVILDGLGEGTGLSDRERRHLEAARTYAEGDLRGAGERLAALTVEYPRDVLALAVGHQIDFFCGDAAGLRDRPGGVLLSWDRTHPLFGFVLGMHAFGLEESNLHPQAEALGRQALEADPRDVWALHAVIHVHEMEGRFEAGVQFLDERRDDWTTGNFFVVHNAWHEALFRLEAGDIDGVLAIYDATIRRESEPNVALEMVDASSLLWRLHLDGVEVGSRWRALADAWVEKAGEPWYVFNDVHATMAFVADGRLTDARALVARLAAYAAQPGPAVSNQAMTADVGLPVCEAIIAFGEGRYDDVVRMLHPIRKVLHQFGGSNAQRDVIARTLLEAAIRAGHHKLAHSLLSERLALKELSPYNARQLTRLREATGETRGAA